MNAGATNRFGWMWSIFTVRWVLGLIFLMAGWWKCFELTPAGHARQFFIGWFENPQNDVDHWIPVWLLWAIGTTIPVVELVAGLFVCLGLFRRFAYLALAAILVTATYGHLLLEPLFSTTGHIFPRLVLLVFVMVAPPRCDLLSLDAAIERFIAKRKRRIAAESQPPAG